ncbi:MAG TPA: class F sortase [Nocardioides sp.]|nr:class F sortase [Nocardioides sp.]
MNKLCRIPVVVALALLACLTVALPSSAAPAPPRAAPRLVIGPGTTAEPGFVGYVTSGGAALGVARLRDGRYGICLDTGRRVWPDRRGSGVWRRDPRVGYLTSRYLPVARREPVTAAALWWAVGLDLGLNSGRARMRRHLAVVRTESPALFGRIRLRHRALLTDLRSHGSASGRYLAARPVLSRDHVSGLALRSDTGAAVPGVRVALRLSGGTFADGGQTWSGSAGASPRWRRSSDGGAVHLEVRYTGVPASGYLLERSGARYQRVAVAARLGVAVRSASLPALPVPVLHTVVSSGLSVVGDTTSDAVTVHGSGGAVLSGQWRLLGPLQPGATGCAGLDWSQAATASSGDFTVTGDGTSTVGAATLASAGCFTYVERLDASPSTRATAWTTAGDASETTLTRAHPTLSTRVSRERATVGDGLHDVVTVRGLPTGSPARLDWRLLGPLAPDGASCRGVRWSGAPVRAAGQLDVAHDGSVVVGALTISRGGCYTYQERLDATPTSLATGWTAAGLVAESTTVGPRAPRVPPHPQVDTGGSRPAVRGQRAMGPGAAVRIPGGSADVPLSPIGFRDAVLTPPSVDVAGWWSGGAHPDALVGTTVLAGHVSDDRGRLGPFARLRRTRVGAVVTTTWAGVETRWRVTTVRSYDRRDLARSLFAQDVVRRLVLITCTDRVDGPGGSFHYRRNLVVTAVPASIRR